MKAKGEAAFEHVDYEKWCGMSIFEQMGNIGSEVGRAISAERRKDETLRDAAVARAIDLFDVTADALAGANLARLKEVLRAKEEFLGLFFDDKFDEADGVERYFMQFAMAARRGR